MYGGPDSVHACEHLSITICRPLVASVSSRELGEALVVRVTDARSSEPELLRSTLRWIVSPGAIALAPMLSRFVEAPVAPSAIVTVPEEIVWLEDVVLVKVAKVARPAMLAAAPRTAMVAISLFAVVVRRLLRARRRKDFVVNRDLLVGGSPVTPSARGGVSLIGSIG